MSQWVVVILCYFQVPVKSYDVHKEMFEAPWIPTDARIPLHLARHSQSREVGTGSAFISAQPPRPTRWFDNFLFGNWGWWYLVISGDGAIMFTKRGQVTKFPRSHHLWTALEGYGGIWRDDGCADRCSCRYIYIYHVTFVYLCIPYMTYMTYIYLYDLYVCRFEMVWKSSTPHQFQWCEAWKLQKVLEWYLADSSSIQ
jgi:hypothetical protein